jgi:carbon-monoxide dehydrogenase medium subunit
MKSAPFAYYDPRTIGEVVGLLTSLENAQILAGGQSLVPMLNLRVVFPDHVIDLNRVAGLDRVELTGDVLHVGAMARQYVLEAHSDVKARVPILADALRQVGHFQTRSRGTFGGSLCHLDPAAELPGIAALYDATLHVEGTHGRRDISIADWPKDLMTPNLAADEVLLGASLSLWPSPHGHAFVEFARRQGDFAIAGVGALLSLNANDVIDRCAIVVVGMSARPIRLAAAEHLLVGAAPTVDAFKAAAMAVGKYEALSDLHGSASYRQHLASVLTRRALEQAAFRCRELRNDRA